MKKAFLEVGIEVGFRFEHENEEGYVVKCKNEKYQVKEGTIVVKVDPRYYRPTEVDLLIGDATKAKTKLGWIPKYDLAALVKEMVASDVELFSREKHLKESGFQIKNEFE